MTDHLPQSVSPTIPSRLTYLWVLAGLVLVAALVRLPDIAGRDVWVDEANTIIIARQPLPQLIDRLQLDSSPPLYYLILHYWMRLFGDGILAVRSLSALFGLMLVGCTFHVGRKLFSTQAGLFAALLVSFAPIQVIYSQQVRMYSLLPLAALLSAYYLWRAIERPTTGNFVGYVLATLASLYTHNYAFYLLPAHLVVLIWSGALVARPARWLASAGLIVVGYLPWLPSFLMQLENRGQYRWFEPFWEAWGPFGSLWRTFDSFAAGRFSVSYIWYGSSEIVPPVRLALFGLTILAAVYGMFARRSEGKRVNGPVAMLLTFVGVPLATALLVSSVAAPNHIPGRCDQLVYAGFGLLAAVGLTMIRPLLLRIAALILLIAFSVSNLPIMGVAARPPEDKAIAQAIAAVAKPGDAIVCTSLTRASLEYYLDQAKAPVTFVSYPSGTAEHLGNQDDDTLLQDPGSLWKEAAEVEQQLRDCIGPAGRFFLVLAHDREPVVDQRHRLHLKIKPVNRPLVQYLLNPRRSEFIRRLGVFHQSVIQLPVTVTLHRLRADQ